MFQTQSLLKPTEVNHTSELFHLAFTYIMIYFSYSHLFKLSKFEIFSATGVEVSVFHKVLASRLAS